MELLAEYGVWGLFLASFLAATILPLASEIVLVAVVAAGARSLGGSLGCRSGKYPGRHDQLLPGVFL